MEKRRPLLADLLLQRPVSTAAQKMLLVSSGAELAQSLIRRARRFVLDSAATARFAEVMRDIPDVIATQQQFARPPYEIMWIEFSSRDVFRIVAEQDPDDTADLRVGYLFTEDVVICYVEGSYDGVLDTNILPIGFRLHTPWRLEDQLHFADTVGSSRLGLVNWVWGSVLSHWLNGARTFSEADDGKLTLAKTLRDLHTPFWINEPWLMRHTTPAGRASLLEASAGDLRNIITLLLLMNQPSVVNSASSQEIGFTRGFVKGKLRTYLSHNVVSIPIDPRPALRNLNLAHQASPHRRHEVRGHYCHDEITRLGSRRGCEHHWTQDDENHWHCLTCGGRRWWRRQHERGDASVGFVTKDYALAGQPHKE